MPHVFVKPTKLNKLGRWRLLRVTKKYRQLKPLAKKAETARERLRKQDGWAFSFLEHQSILKPKPGEWHRLFVVRASRVINELEEPLRERAKNAFLAQSDFLRADKKWSKAAWERMIIKYGLQRVK